MTEEQFHTLERWALSAAMMVVEGERSRGQMLSSTKRIYDACREEARHLFVQPKETDQ